MEKWRYKSDNGRQGARRTGQDHQDSSRAALVYIWRAFKKKRKSEFIRYERCYIINVNICKEACL